MHSRGGVEDTRLEAKYTKKNPRPNTQKKSEAKNSPSEGRPCRGQGQECSRPIPRTKNTSASVLQKQKGLQKIYSGDLQKIGHQKMFQAICKILIQKLVLPLGRGQCNFRGLEDSRPRPRTLPLRPRPRTSKCVLETKDVLEDSTSGAQSRPGATGGLTRAVPPQMTSCAPPNKTCAPPERGLCPEEIHRLGTLD